MQIITLVADEGKFFTDGEIYGKTIYLAANRDISEFYEITEGELEQWEEKQSIH